jgi:hypothetical protein
MHINARSNSTSTIVRLSFFRPIPDFFQIVKVLTELVQNDIYKHFLNYFNPCGPIYHRRPLEQ